MATLKEAAEPFLRELINKKLGSEVSLEICTAVTVLVVTVLFLFLGIRLSPCMSFFCFFDHVDVSVSVARTAFRRKRPETILLVGLSGAGKTTLYYQLRDGSTHNGTVTSMEPNIDRFVLHSEITKQVKAKPVRIVDVPGHLRLRSKLDEFLPEAGGIVFLVDAADFISNVRATAEYLYDLLSKAVVVKKKIPVLIVCNKMDKVTAHAPDFIRKQLEKEIEKLSISWNAMSAADVASEVKLGKEGETFKFTHCVNKVIFEEAAVITNQITSIEEFIRSYV